MMLGVVFGGLTSILSGANILKIGLMAASAAGMYLLNGKKEKGEVARLDDLKVSSSSYGRGISIVYGTMRVTGNMIWATDFEETLKYIGGKSKKGDKKGKGGTPYYEYHANFAMALCEGPVEELLRVWADSNLIYDKHNPDNPDIVSIGFSQPDNGSGGKSGFGGNKKKGGEGGESGRFLFRFYPGLENQMPDPFMLEKQDASLVPAYRGLCYLMFEHFALADFGNRIPTITAEVTTKKQLGLTYKVIENLPDANLYRAASQNTVAIDPERYRLYELAVSDTLGSSIRVFDMNTNTEINRITLAKIEEINDWGTTIFGGFNLFLGLSGLGDLAFTIGSLGDNRNAWFNVVFLDPNSFLEKARIFVPLPVAVYPYVYIEEEHVFGVPTKYEVRRATIISSWAGVFNILGQEYEHVARLRYRQGLFQPTYDIAYGPPEIEGGRFWFTTSNQVATAVALLELKWGIVRDPDGNPDTTEYQTPSARTIRYLSSGTGFFTSQVFINPPFYLLSLERLAWFEQIRSGSPATQGSFVVLYNPKTYEIEWRYKYDDSWSNTPMASFFYYFQRQPAILGSSYKWITGGGTVWSVDFANRKVSYYNIGRMDEYFVNGSSLGWQHTYWPARNAVIAKVNDPNDGGEAKWAMILLDRNVQTAVEVGYIISDISRRVGIPPSKVNLTKLDVDTIIGYIIEQPTAGRKVVEDLAQVFMFDVAEIDYELHAVSRGNASIVTIPQKDLGIIESDTHEYYIETTQQNIDLPQTVVVSFINPNKDYQVNSRHYRRPRSPMPVMQSRERLELQLPMAMKPQFAKRLSHKITKSLWSERTYYDVILPWKYLIYDPTDVMTYEMDDGLTIEARTMKMDLGANFSIEFSGVAQSVASYESDAEVDPDGGVVPIPNPAAPQSKPIILNVPYLEDTDDVGNARFLYYWGAGAFSDGFRGAAVEYRFEGDDWRLVDLAAEEAVWGWISGTVPPPPWGPFATDDVNEITLIPAFDYGSKYSWESIPESAWPSEQNIVVIGDEVIYFRDVTINETGSITISHLIRGARGTENAAYEHVAGETFVINTDGLRNEVAPMSWVNRLWSFRSFSTLSIMPQYIETITLEGASHKPWALSYFRRSGTTNILIDWERRTRYNGALKDGTSSVPLNEETELYEIYLLAAPYDPDTFDPDDPGTYVRMYERTTSSLTYTEAEQLADGYVNTQPIHVVGYQISAAVGRGFPGYATLYPTVLI